MTETQKPAVRDDRSASLEAALRISLARLRICRNDAATRGRISEAEEINATVLVVKDAIARAEGKES